MIKRKSIIQYFFSDWVSALIVWLLFCAFRRVANDMVLFGNLPIFTPSFNFYLTVIFYPILALCVHYLSGFYNRSRSHSRITELFSTLSSAFVIALVAYFSLLIDDVVVSYTFYYKSFLALWGLQFFVTYVFRVFLTHRAYLRLRKGKESIPVLILGTGTLARKVTDNMELQLRKTGRVIVGYVRMDGESKSSDIQVLGTMKNISNIIHSNSIHHVIIALDKIDEEGLYAIIGQLMKYDVEIQFPPRSLGILTSRIRLYDLDSSPFVSLTDASMPVWQQSFKRVFDIVISCFALLLLSPLMIYVALRVKCGSPGTLFYKQERIGRFGKPFMIYKFRTMYQNAEQKGPQLSSVNDDRITPFGLVMRKYRLDELPQFWNIIIGDMSVVGPRPERRFYINQIEEIAPYYCLLYKIKPGLLSWGPIKIGYSDSIEKMVERLNYDLIYMDNMTLLTDLKIMIYSIEVILNGRGV